VDGPPATLIAADSPTATVVLPEVSEGGADLTFRLTLVAPNGETAVDEVAVRVFDSGVFDRQDGVLWFDSATGRELGVRIEGGGLKELTPLPSSMVDDTENRPWNMMYGLIRLETTGDGGDLLARFFFPEPAIDGERRYGGYRYDSDGGWRRIENARLSDDLKGMDVPLNGETVQTIGFGISYVRQEESGGSGGGGCFIQAVGVGALSP